MLRAHPVPLTAPPRGTLEVGALGVAAAALIAALTLALTLAPAAHAQDASPPPSGQEPAQTDALDEAARLTFESAREAFVAGDYETALVRFRQAYQLSNRPGLLYNIAQTLDRLRRDEETVQALRDYLAAYPAAPNRSEVEARIRVLEATLERNRPDPEPTPEPDPDPDPAVSGGAGSRDAGGGSDLAILHPAIFLAVGGLALVGGGLAIWTGLTTLSLNQDYQDSTNVTDAQRLYDDASTYQLLTNVFLFSSAGLAAVAVVLAILTDWDALGGGGDSSSAALRPSFGVGPTGGSLGLEGSF